jgi:phosphatidylethanolamine-binding protein (PEBP) family uncharacterized protein
MRPRATAISDVVLLLALACAGCGSGSSTSVATISFRSPAVVGSSIPALYTCAGKNTSPPLEWGPAPPGTSELALFILGFTPAAVGNQYTVSVEWAVAGLNPSLRKLAAGVLPHGAHLGRDSDSKTHYSICPKRGTTERYQFELYALSRTMSIRPHFTGLPVVATLANAKPSEPTLAHGGFAVSYKRT